MFTIVFDEILDITNRVIFQLQAIVPIQNPNKSKNYAPGCSLAVGAAQRATRSGSTAAR